MAEEKTLGRLPKWPRQALNNSVIAAEQAYRKRSGLPLLTDADIEALRAGVPMSWEGADGSSAAPAPPAPAAPASAPAAPAAAANQSGFSPDVQKWLAAGKKWSKSAIAAEQARRKRTNLPALTDAEIAALLDEPAAPAAAPATPAAPAATAAAPRPTTPAAPKPAMP